MSSINFRQLTVQLALGILVSIALCAQEKEPETAFGCPATITVSESAAPIPGWQTATTRATRAFERISIYNGKAGGQEYELAPDDEKRNGSGITQTWRLHGYQDMNIFLRCRYRGTQVLLFKDIPKKFEVCTFKFQTGKNGEVTGSPSFSCH